MAKSFTDYFGDFNSMRDKLMYAVGDLAQIPQRATLLEPRVAAFIASTNPVLQNTGAALKARINAVRDSARLQFDKTQALITEMTGFKDTIEKSKLYAELMTGSKVENILTAVSSLFNKSGNAQFIQEAVLKAVNLAGRGADALVTLGKASVEVKALEDLAQRTADYAQGKGLLPDVNTPSDIKPVISKAMIAAGAGVLGLAIYFFKRK